MDPNLISHDANDNFADEDKIDLDDIKGKIFIGGLSWQTSEANLRYYFEKFGELSDVALMIDKRTGKPRGFGFIKMKDPAAADIVMSTEHTIDGRLVDVKRALPRDKAPGPTRSEACKIFVGGLAPEITEKEFGDYFSKFGIVKDAVVMVDRNTGSSRGFGFVTFEVEETVEQVMKIQHEIMGKYVEIKRAEPRDSSRGSVGGYDNGGGQTMYGGMGGYGGRMAGGGGGRGGPGGMTNGMGGPRYGGGAGGAPGGMRDAGGMMAGGYGAPPMGAPMGGAYGGYMGGQGMRGAPAGPAQGYGRYTPGYGGAAAATSVFRGPAGYGGMAAPAGGAGYGYPNPSAMAPQGMAGYYGGATLAPAPAAFAGYGGVGAPQGGAPGPAGAAAGYGGATQYSPTGGRPGPFPADGGPADFSGQPVDGRPGQPKDGYDNSAIAAGYANAAAMQLRAQQQQQQYPYGGATLAPAGPYGGAAPAPYGVYGGAVPGATQAAAPRPGGGALPEGGAAPYGSAGGESNYGAYRGQGATQGRVDRSYRPY